MRPSSAFVESVWRKRSAFAAWSRDNRLLLGAYCVCLAMMFLVESNHAPKDVYYAVVLPLGLLAASPFGLRMIRQSIIFWAMTLYLVMIGLSQLALPDLRFKHAMDYFGDTVAVLTFLIATAYLTQARVQCLRPLLLPLCCAAAASAGLNTVLSLVLHDSSSLARLLANRLVASWGMPGYENSTNIGITYAVYFVASGATLTAGGLIRWQRALLVAAFLVLGLALLLTQARGAGLGAAAGVFSLIMIDSRRRRLALPLTAALLLLLPLAIALPDGMLSRGDSHRFVAWQHYLALAAAHPWLGYGIWTDIRFTSPDGVPIVHPHNWLLSAQIRGGIGASLALLVAMVAALRWSFLNFRAAGSGAPFALLITIMTAGLFDYDLWSTGPSWPWVTFWLPMGLCIGAEMHLRLAAREDAGPCGPPEAMLPRTNAMKGS